MRNFLLPILAIWAIVASPGLCVAGVLEHLCAGCPETVACDHEDDCAVDPCVDSAVRPVVGADVGVLAPIVALVQTYVSVEFDVVQHEARGIDPFPPERKKLSQLESDLPLLN
ncbi:MAG: hypothetical protein R3E97_00105 [Candidatus Eisenbacteria bacterium]